MTGAGLGFALQANLAISIAAVGEQPGAITAYSYAFFLATMILALSSLADVRRVQGDGCQRSRLARLLGLRGRQGAGARRLLRRRPLDPSLVQV